MSLRVAFDLDGVLADFRNAFEAAGRGERGAPAPATDPEQAAAEPLSARDVHRAWKVVDRTANWWLTLQPYEPEEIARLYRLTRTLKWEVFFVTRRPKSAGESVQFQTQWWLEAHGFYLPSVLTVLGSRGEIANGLRLDVIVDDQIHNLIDVISASTAKGLLMARSDAPPNVAEHATSRGIGVVATLRDALDVLERLDGIRAGRIRPGGRFAEWFFGARRSDTSIPLNPREQRPLPPLEEPTA